VVSVRLCERDWKVVVGGLVRERVDGLDDRSGRDGEDSVVEIARVRIGVAVRKGRLGQPWRQARILRVSERGNRGALAYRLGGIGGLPMAGDLDQVAACVVKHRCCHRPTLDRRLSKLDAE
jgi:hypothetical protein